jgi:hypothetical protein
MVIKIGSQIFHTQKAVRQYVKELFQTQPSEIYPDCPEFEFWDNLFKRHPDYEQKLGGGNINHFIFDKPHHMSFHLDEGETETFSWNLCITQRVETKLSETIAAMRMLIQPQINDFKLSNESVCSECGTAGFCEVDHINPFKEIREDFFKEFDVNVDELNMTSARFEVFYNVEDTYTHSFIEDWKIYHDQKCRLQYLCKPCHKVKTLDERISKTYKIEPTTSTSKDYSNCVCYDDTLLTFGKFKGKPHTVLLEPRNRAYCEWLKNVENFGMSTKKYLEYKATHGGPLLRPTLLR